MAEEIPSMESFAVTLEKLKLPKTANVLREELEKKNNIQKIQKALESNLFVNHISKKLEAPKKENKNMKEESKNMEDKILYSKSNLSLLETKIFKKLYESFDSNKINKTSLTKLMLSNDLNDSNINLNINDQNKEKLNSSDINSKKKKKNNNNNSEIINNSEINENKNNSLLNSTNNNEEDSIFTNANASNIDDSNATQFNPPPKKINPRRKKDDKRDRPFAGNAQLDKMLKINQIKFNQSGVSNIDNSSFFVNSRLADQSSTNKDGILNQSDIDEYVDDDDPGFDLFECDRIYQNNTSKQLAEQYGYPERAVFKSKYKNLLSFNKNEKHRSRDDTVEHSKSNLPDGVKFMKSNDPYYPIINNNVILDSFDLKVVVNREKIGFEQEKELKFKKDELIAGRYCFERELGDAAFSTAVQCFDI